MIDGWRFEKRDRPGLASARGNPTRTVNRQEPIKGAAGEAMAFRKISLAPTPLARR
jgi:hypothetical protein